MAAFALIIAWALAGQANPPDGRYEFSSSGQAGAANGQAGAAEARTATGAVNALRSGANETKAIGADRAGATSLGGATDAGRESSTVDGAPPRTLPLMGSDSQPITGTNPAASAGHAYDVSPAQSIAAVPNSGLSPSAMMRAMMAVQSGSQLRGQSVALIEVIEGARTRAEQTQRVEAYWDLCSSVADYYLGLREQEELRRYVQRGGQWDQFELEMRNRSGTAQRAALASQLRLASMLGRGSGFLPLPADAPHCASYHTHYQQIFPNGGPPEAKELNELLPLRYNELKGAAALVADTEQYLNSFATSRSNDIDGGLKALHLLALQRRAFVQIARDYNRRIARYAELASPGPLTPERLTGMLIKSPVSTATRSASPGALQNRQTNRKAPISTFADGATPPKRDDAVRPALGTESPASGQSSPRREHSLLVTPRD